MQRIMRIIKIGLYVLFVIVLCYTVFLRTFLAKDIGELVLYLLMFLGSIQMFTHISKTSNNGDTIVRVESFTSIFTIIVSLFLIFVAIFK